MASDSSSGSFPSRTAIHFGAGSIGLGFIGPLLVNAGFHVIFADIDQEVIDRLNQDRVYKIHYLEPRRPRAFNVTHISGALSGSDEIARDIADSETKLVTTSVGFGALKHVAPAIARGLLLRSQDPGSGTMNVIACENGKGATELLQAEVFKHLETDGMKKWVDEYVGFANCSVDRIVPPVEHTQSRPLDVGVDRFYEWMVDVNALKGLSRNSQSLDIPGMTATSNLNAFVERKLFILNCGHVITAYLGHIFHHRTIYDSVHDTARILPIVEGAMCESSAALLVKYPDLFNSIEQEAYVQKVLGRFRNPNITDEVQRVARQPLRKLGQDDRLLGPFTIALQYKLPVKNLALGISAAFMYRNNHDEQAVEMKKIMDAEGVPQTMEKITGLSRDSPGFKEITDAWNILQELVVQVGKG